MGLMMRMVGPGTDPWVEALRDMWMSDAAAAERGQRAVMTEVLGHAHRAGLDMDIGFRDAVALAERLHPIPRFDPHAMPPESRRAEFTAKLDEWTTYIRRLRAGDRSDDMLLPPGFTRIPGTVRPSQPPAPV